jgi:hypothetical protein
MRHTDLFPAGFAHDSGAKKNRVRQYESCKKAVFYVNASSSLRCERVHYIRSLFDEQLRSRDEMSSGAMEILPVAID